MAQPEKSETHPGAVFAVSLVCGLIAASVTVNVFTFRETLRISSAQHAAEFTSLNVGPNLQRLHDRVDKHFLDEIAAISKCGER